MDVRLAEPDELARVGEITAAAYAEFTTGPDDSYVERLRDAASRAVQAELWVATEHGDLLGTVTWCPPGSPWRELAKPNEGELRMLAVAPAARGRGAGRALVERCEERARGDGATAMVLSSLPQMTAAHRIYLQGGYRRAPERDWSPVPGVQLIAFTKNLEQP